MSKRHLKNRVRHPFLWLVFLCFFSTLPAFSGNKPFLGKEQTPTHKTEAEHNPDLLIGERLFYGLTPWQAGAFQCEACHSVITSEDLNWSPSAFNLSEWMKNQSDSAVKQLLENPISEKMEAAHPGFTVTDEEVRQLRTYLNYINQKGLALHKPFPAKMILFFGFGILMALALLDLIFFRKIKYRIIHILVLIAGLAIHGQIAITEARNLGRTKGYAPDQPIKFSHKVHAGDNKIDCKYCHTGVYTGKSAGIPSLNLCMNCHTVVKSGRNSGKFEIQMIYDHLKNNQPVEWIRIHNLPEYVYFNHAQHVMVGKVPCQKCHGPVETMDLMRQFSDLSMGWCVNCHRQTQIQSKTQPYYTRNTKLLEWVQKEKLPNLTVEQIGGIDCMKCHY